jgi:hypothetical protein
MNIYKNKKFIATTLTFVLVIAWAGLPLPAKERRGATVVVTMTAGRGVLKGELLAVKEDSLLVYDHDALQGKSIDLKDVFQVKVLKKLNFLRGMGIGLVVGLGMCVYQYELSGQPSEMEPIGYIVGPLSTGLYGGLIGLVVRNYAGKTQTA